MSTFDSRASAVIIAALALAPAGCSKSERAALSEGARAAGVRVGDRVVVESAVATFVEGVVASVNRDRARVQMGPGGETSELALADLYVPPRADVPPKGPATAEPARGDPRAAASGSTLRDGTYAVCRTSAAGWRPCRIEAVGASIKVVDDETNRADLSWRDILAPTPVTELNVRQRFDRSAKRRAFRDGAKAAGRPRVPANWRPGLNERVIVERDGAWVGALAKGSTRSSTHVLWDADRRLGDALLADMAPEPPIDFAPTVGTYVLSRPAIAGRPWSVMRIESTGTTSLALSDESGELRQVAIRDVAPLERGR